MEKIMSGKKISCMVLSSMIVIGCMVPPNAMAQDNSPAKIWKHIRELEKQGFSEVGGKNYRGAANTFLSVVDLMHQLPENDPKLKEHYKTVEANLNVIDNRLETKGDMALKEKVVRARLSLLEKTTGKQGLAYQVGLKKLMFSLSEQGKTNEIAELDKQLNKDVEGPAPNRQMKTIGRKSARPK
jgi:hypothetical protein